MAKQSDSEHNPDSDYVSSSRSGSGWPKGFRTPSGARLRRFDPEIDD